MVLDEPSETTRLPAWAAVPRVAVPPDTVKFVPTVAEPSTVRLSTPAPEFCRARVVLAPSTRSKLVVPAEVLCSVAELSSIDDPERVVIAPELPMLVAAVPVVFIVVAPSILVVDAEFPMAMVPEFEVAPILVFDEPVALILVVPRIVSPPVPWIKPVPELTPTAVTAPVLDTWKASPVPANKVPETSRLPVIKVSLPAGAIVKSPAAVVISPPFTAKSPLRVELPVTASVPPIV